VGGAYAFLVAYATSLYSKNKPNFIMSLESSQYPLFFWDKTWQLQRGSAMSVAFFFFSSSRKSHWSFGPSFDF